MTIQQAEELDVALKNNYKIDKRSVFQVSKTFTSPRAGRIQALAQEENRVRRVRHQIASKFLRLVLVAAVAAWGGSLWQLSQKPVVKQVEPQIEKYQPAVAVPVLPQPQPQRQMPVIEDEAPQVVVGDFLAYMSAHKITSKNTLQYALLQSDYVETGEEGIMVYREGHKEFYGVALGSYFAPAGKPWGPGYTYDVYCETPDGGIEIVPVITMDVKADQHTDESNRFTVHGGKKCLVEVVVDSQQVPSQVRKLGSYTGSETFPGPVVAIRLRGASQARKLWDAGFRNL